MARKDIGRKEDPFSTVNIPLSIKKQMDSMKKPYEPHYVFVKRLMGGKRK